MAHRFGTDLLMQVLFNLSLFLPPLTRLPGNSSRQWNVSSEGGVCSIDTGLCCSGLTLVRE